MSIELLTLILFLCLLVMLVSGLPVAFCVGGIGIVFAAFLWGPQSLVMIALRSRQISETFLLIAIPMFIFMGVILERSGIADDLYEAFYRWMGPTKGGLAIGTVLICTLFAAMVGLTGPATVTMGLVALPSMLKRGYAKDISIGCIMAGGALGFLIPPSVTAIMYALIAEQSVGKLFAGGIIPGILLATLFIIYIVVRSAIQPHLCPALPPEERASWREKFTSLRILVLPLALILAVLGSLFMGVATASEASAIGAAGSIVCAIIMRRLNWRVITEAADRTLRLTGMVMWIVYGSLCFSTVYSGLGAVELIENLIATFNLNPWGVLILMQISYFFLGFILDDTAIIFICLPLYVPIAAGLGFDLIWFGILFIVNLQMAFLTPPVGYNLFYMKGVVPLVAPDITLGDIYRSAWPFVILQGVGLAAVIMFPQLALWLPRIMFAK